MLLDMDGGGGGGLGGREESSGRQREEGQMRERMGEGDMRTGGGEAGPGSPRRARGCEMAGGFERRGVVRWQEAWEWAGGEGW